MRTLCTGTMSCFQRSAAARFLAHVTGSKRAPATPWRSNDSAACVDASNSDAIVRPKSFRVESGPQLSFSSGSCFAPAPQCGHVVNSS